jgi:hypothetical protein
VVFLFLNIFFLMIIVLIVIVSSADRFLLVVVGYDALLSPQFLQNEIRAVSHTTEPKPVTSKLLQY